MLDLACGKGRHSIYLNKLGYNVIGADLSKNSIQFAKEFENNRLHFVEHDMRNPLEKKYNAILNLFTSFGFFENDAEDIAIQTFSKAFSKIDTFDEKYVFKTWLISISKNVHIDLLRKKNASISIETTIEQEEKVYLVVDENPTPEDNIIREQNLAKLLRDIKQLKPKYQKVIQLRYFEELSYKEISTQINEPISNVSVKLLVV